MLDHDPRDDRWFAGRSSSMSSVSFVVGRSRFLDEEETLV